MRAFELARVTEERATLGKLYLESLRIPSTSAGLYALEAGSVELRKPPAEAGQASG